MNIILKRNDLLPEETSYFDKGCVLYPHCLSCPRTVCAYEEGRGIIRVKSRKRDREILNKFKEGLCRNEIAKIFGVSRRTVQRALKRTANRD